MDQWTEMLRTLVTATRFPSQAKLAKELNCSPAAMSRYLAGQRIPDEAIVVRIVELARRNDSSIDRNAVLLCHAEVRAWQPPAAPNAENKPGRRKNIRLPVLVTIGIVVLVAGFLLLRADFGTEPNCLGPACTGKNHHGQGCDDPIEELAGSDRMADGTIVRLLYSAECEAAWARAHAAAGAVVEVTDDRGNTQDARGRGNDGEATFTPTPMIAAPPGVRLHACVTTDAYRVCTTKVAAPR